MGDHDPECDRFFRMRRCRVTLPRVMMSARPRDIAAWSGDRPGTMTGARSIREYGIRLPAATVTVTDLRNRVDFVRISGVTGMFRFRAGAGVSLPTENLDKVVNLDGTCD